MEVLCRDSFRTWKSSYLLIDIVNKKIFLHHKLTSKPFVTISLNKVSITVIEKTIRITKKKGFPVYIQFKTEDDAISVFKDLRVYTKDYSTTVLLDGFNSACVMANESGIIISVNNKFLDLVGYSKDELIGQNVTILMDIHIARIHDQLIENYWKTGIRRLVGKTRLVRIKHKDGHLFPIVIQLGELVESFEGSMVTRLISTFTTTEGDYTVTPLSNDTDSTVDVENWSEEENDFVEIIDKISCYIEVYNNIEEIFTQPGDKEKVKILLFSLNNQENIDFPSISIHNMCKLLKYCVREQKIFNGDTYDKLLNLSEFIYDVTFFPKLFDILLTLSEDSQMIYKRIILLLSQLLSMKIPLTINKLSNIATSIFFSKLKLEHHKIFSLIFQQCIVNFPVIITYLPSCDSFTFFEGAERLSDTDWVKLMTKSQIIEYSTNDIIIPDDGRDKKLYYLASGSIEVTKDNYKSFIFSREYVTEMANITASRTSAIAIAKQPCKIIKLSVSFLQGLFESDSTLFYKFFWDQARILVSRLKTFPSVLSEDMYKLTEPSNEEKIAKIEIHLDDDTSIWLDFPYTYTVKNIADHLQNIYPKYGKKSYLIETSHGRSLEKLKDTWTVQGLLVRAKYACDYKIIYIPDEPIKKKNDLKTKPYDHIIIKQYSCKRKKRLGVMFICQKNLIHISKTFGISKKYSVSLIDITKTSQKKNIITICYSGNKSCDFVFKSESNCSEARRLIQSLAKDSSLQYSTERKQSSDHIENDWGIIKKHYTIPQPQNIQLLKGETIQICNIDKGIIYGIYKNIDIALPAKIVEQFESSIFSESTMMLLATEKWGELNYPNLEQLPSKRDWCKFLQHGKIIKYNHGDVIIPIGSKLQNYYQIISGGCDVKIIISKIQADEAKNSEKWNDKITDINNTPYSSLTIQSIGKGECFGEMSIINAGGSMASVIASGIDDSTLVFVIDVLSLKKLFTESPIFGGRFAKYFINVMKERLNTSLHNMN